jgi:hypothetical protein
LAYLCECFASLRFLPGREHDRKERKEGAKNHEEDGVILWKRVATLPELKR